MASSEYVTLVSAEGFEFVVERRCALMSGTIKAMLTGPGLPALILLYFSQA
jgi:transcription elongation factor B subunit 1